MKKLQNAILLVLCAVLLVSASVVGTLAYLQYKTDPVTNTMTVGKVEITLDEAKVDVYGVPVEGADRVTENTYKLIPGHEYTKDPIVTVETGSEPCYLFVEVVNGISNVEIESGNTIEAQMTANGWSRLTTDSTVWYKSTAVDARENAVEVAVFTTFTINGEADVSACVGKTITITAYAIQADGFDTAADAWEASGFANS